MTWAAVVELASNKDAWKYDPGLIYSRGHEPTEHHQGSNPRNFPSPTSVSELRSFLGLANQLGSFLPDLAHSTARMRELLKKGNAFNWLPEHESEFSIAKKLLCSSALVKPFDPNFRTELLTDALRLHGLGYALIQRDGFERPRLIQCGSCSLTDAQKNYATVELEASAVLWAIIKCDHHLHGLSLFFVITDHCPLLGVFMRQLPAIANDWLQRIRERLLMYSFDVHWSAGKEHSIADALSRAPFFPPDPTCEVAVCAIREDDPQLRQITEGIDDEYLLLRATIVAGRPLPPRLACYRGLEQTLSVETGLVCAGARQVVPCPVWRTIIDLVPTSHS